MTISVGNAFAYMFFVWVLPFFTGNTACGILRINGTTARSFFAGHIVSWAIFQILAVPLILGKASFLVLVVLYTGLIVGLTAYGIYKKIWKSLKPKRMQWTEWMAVGIMACAVLYIVLQSCRLQLTNDDDSRFVVNAVDTVRTNRMLLTDVNTGNAITSWTGDLFKDVISPWSVYMAYLSKVTGIAAASMIHTYLPPVLLLLMCCVFWLIAGDLFHGETVYRVIFVCVVILLYVYGYYSIYGTETFTLTRIWQGKAVLAGIGIPAMLYVLLQLYLGIPQQEMWRARPKLSDEAKGWLLMLVIAVFGLALLSSMSYILTTVILGSFGLAYGLEKKSWRIACGIWCVCVVNAIYLGISCLIS